MERDRLVETEVTDKVRQTVRSPIAQDAQDRVLAEPTSSFDTSGDALNPNEQDVLVGSASADTLPSDVLRDPREITPRGGARDRVIAEGTNIAATNMAGRTLNQNEPVTAINRNPAAPDQGSTEIFAQIREGMKVIDANGKNIGKVDYVSMGDPEAASLQGQEMETSGGLLGTLGNVLTDVDGSALPEPFHSRLVHDGFVRVDGKGWFGTDRFLTADLISQVAGDEVHLNVTKNSVPKDES